MSTKANRSNRMRKEIVLRIREKNRGAGHVSQLDRSQIGCIRKRGMRLREKQVPAWELIRVNSLEKQENSSLLVGG